MEEEQNVNNVSNNKKKKVKAFVKKKKLKNPEEILIQKLQESYDNVNTDEIKSFEDLPLTKNTLKGLHSNGFHSPTDIQRQSIILSLRGKDILGASQTGSGKTLAFLIPILEVLYCNRWSNLDGIGALVITPTRELAYQIYETLVRIGENHEFSAGLIIGGKDLKFERNRMDKCNIIICTPGRLLQHMDENPLFQCDNLKILVLDEADRCLDMGFAQTMNAIIANLPPNRQTLLYSATQTTSVKDLARLSLKDPSYVSVHENKEHKTPSELKQSYMVCDLELKLTVLWSFIKNHKKQKIIVFFSSCKQAKYVYEVFCRLRPGTTLLTLYGTLHQLKRMEVYDNFCKKNAAVLFATDLAARGLDFPRVNWVVQVDCPEDAATYIHRVGRTARYDRGGESLLLLLPSELAMLDELKENKVPIEMIDINSDRLQNPVRKMEAYLAKDVNLKDTAQRAFKLYIKTIYLMKNKKVFKVNELNTDAFARSLGLAIPPRIRFLERANIKPVLPPTKQTNRIKFDSDDEEDTKATPNIPSNDSGVSEDENVPFHVKEDSDDDILMVKRKDHDIDLPADSEMAALNMGRKSKKPVTKAALVRKMLKKKIVANKKTVFDDEGEVVMDSAKQKRSEMAQAYENADEGGIDIEKAKIILKEEDIFDKQLFKEKVKAKHKEEKRKLKEKKKAERGEKDDFGTDSEDEAPDLSWLPDPDRIYGERNIDDIENYDDFVNKNGNDETATVEKEEGTKPKEKSKKRKVKTENVKLKKKKQKLDNACAALSVNEAEELAMMLLKTNQPPNLNCTVTASHAFRELPWE